MGLIDRLDQPSRFNIDILLNAVVPGLCSNDCGSLTVNVLNGLNWTSLCTVGV